MNKVYYIRTPISNETLQHIMVGDIIYLSGIVVTARDMIHKCVVEHKVKLPISIKGLAVFHAGPVVYNVEGTWKVVSIGPTTSTRMEPYEAEFIEKTGVKVIIGKGYMGKKTAEACKKHTAIITIFPGGCAAIAAKAIRKVLNVYWLELGIPEALWVLEVNNLGPLIVSIDARGNNIFENILARIRQKKETIADELKRYLSSTLY